MFTFVKELSPTWAARQVVVGLLFEAGVEERAPFSPCCLVVRELKRNGKKKDKDINTYEQTDLDSQEKKLILSWTRF
jgi:hypothetical protein